MLRRWVTCSLIGLAGTLVACSGGTSGTTPETSAPDGAPAVTEATPGDSDSAASTDINSDTGVPGVTEPDRGAATDLAARLLAPADVGEGWTADEVPVGADFGSMGDSSCTGYTVDPAIVERVRPRAAVQLQSPKPFGVSVSQSILEGPEAQLQADLAEVFRVDAACAGGDIALDATTTARVEILELGQVGDQQQAARLSIVVGADVVSSGYIAIVRIGRYVFELTLMEDAGGAPSDSKLEPADFEELLRVAVEKLGA